MPGLIVGEGRRRARDNCRILRPYILWKRRKEQLAEGALLSKLKREEEQRRIEEEDKRCKERKARLTRIEEIEKELTRIRKKRNDLEENLKMLQEQKHQLFLCLKNSLLAKEYVRKEKTSNVYPEFHPNDESGADIGTGNWNIQFQQHPTLNRPTSGSHHQSSDYSI